jgi:two-component system chemotaxis response regulator CheY
LFTELERNTKVLVVDDVNSARRVVMRLLEKIGFSDIEEASNGKVALERIEKGDIGLVISDKNMPGLNGLELISNIRNNTALTKLPFLMITSQSSREEVISAVESGANDFIIKPFSYETLAAKLRNVLNRAQD